jgi:hypothetical protein
MAVSKEETNKSDSALARKRRIAMRSKHRLAPTASSTSSEDETSIPRSSLEAEPMVVASSSANTTTKNVSTSEDILQSIRKKKPHITGIKMQSRYDPGVSMTKEELRAWRKEARRVRNRESAAASRKKNREAIDHLETKVKGVQTKYDAALSYILALEEKLRRSGSSSSSSFYPSNVLRQDLEKSRKLSPEGFEETGQMVSPPSSPTPKEMSQEGIQNQAPRPWPVQLENDSDKNTLYHRFSNHHPRHQLTLQSQKHIIDNTIIRPIACV